MSHLQFARLIGVMVWFGAVSAVCPSLAADALPSHGFPSLAGVYARMAAGERVKVAFLGGSITWGACASDPLKTSYRALVSSQLEAQFLAAHFKFIDAAIGGQPSKLAVFRMDRDVVPYQPDLVFIEFAVNDFDTPDSQETMEGIVRKLHRDCPNAAVVILIIGSNWDYHTPAESKHIELAKYYGLPCIDICAAVQTRIKNGLNTHEILSDGCHPNDVGYRLYADIIMAELELQRLERSVEILFPAKPLTANRYESAAMLELSKLADLGKWKVELPSNVGTWFDQQPSRWLSSSIVAHESGSALTVDLRCSILGVYYETTEGAGTLLIEADGNKTLEIPTTMKMAYSRVDFRVAPLDASKQHKIRISVNDGGSGVKVAYLLYCE